MKPILKTLLLLLCVALLFSACSRKGVHMHKNRKSRHCNCPTFSQTVTQQPSAAQAAVSYDESGTV